MIIKVNFQLLKTKKPVPTPAELVQGWINKFPQVGDAIVVFSHLDSGIRQIITEPVIKIKGDVYYTSTCSYKLEKVSIKSTPLTGVRRR